MAQAPIKAGDSVEIEDTLKWGGIVQSLSGATVVIRYIVPSTGVAVEKAAALVTPPGTDGKVRVALTPAETAPLAGVVRFEWVATWADGTTKRFPTKVDDDHAYHELEVLKAI